MLTNDELTNAARGMIRRASVVSLDGSDPDHLRGAFSGMVGHQPANIPIIQDFGFYSEPPAGTSALLLGHGGRHDSLHALGFDNPQYRPAWMGGGATAIYDSSGNILKMVSRNITVVAPSSITLQVGGVTLTITSAGVSITGGYVKSNGHFIDYTHQHTNSGGAGLGGPPQ